MNVFTRNWWKKNPSFPNGLEPDSLARKQYICYGVSESEAVNICREYNATNDPGPLSRKAEFEA